MARNPKLDVFRITLKPFEGRKASFRDFFNEKYKSNKTEGINDEKLYHLFIQDFLNSIDNDKFVKNQAKQKVMAAYDTKDETKKTINIHSVKNVVEGTFEGGKYGDPKNVAAIDNKRKKESIPRDNAILANFYFFLFTPLNSDTGVLMLQSYTEETIRDVFLPFFLPFFSCSNAYFNIAVEPFVPKVYKDKFAKEAELRAFSFTGNQLIGKKIGDKVTTEQDEYIVTIKIVPKDKSKKGIKCIDNTYNKIIESQFNGEELSNFKHKVLLRNSITGKHAHYDISEDISQIRPTIILDEIPRDASGELNIVELRVFCFDLLAEVNQEIQKINLVHEC